MIKVKYIDEVLLPTFSTIRNAKRTVGRISMLILGFKVLVLVELFIH